MRTAKTQNFWEAFRRFEGLNSDAHAITFFRTPPTVADDLLSRIVAGAKRATAGPMHYFGEDREEPLPIVGDCTVLLDRHKNPRLIWRTTQLSVAPLSAVTAEYAWTDGDGGGEREAWLEVIHQSFTAQARRNRFEMHDDIETLFETFEVVWPHATAQRLRRLDAHFQRGLQLLRKLEDDRAFLSKVDAVMAQIETAILIIDSSMRLQYANPAGQTVLQREDGLRLRRGLVTLRYLEDQRQFSSIVAARSPQMAQDARARADKLFTPFQIRRDELARPYRASVFPLTTFNVTALLAPTADLVMFVDDPDRADTTDDGESELFRRAFRLTPAETRLASSLASGASLDQAADAFQITRNTARTQLRAIFDKTDTNRQSDLMRALLTVRTLKLSLR